jgi:predicted lipid-binding transport protein (Tim44 family)
MKGAFKGRSGYVAGGVALLVVGFSLISGLARRIGVVEPRIRIERGGDINPSQAARAARYVTAQSAMAGETATTAERLREASALAAAGAIAAGWQAEKLAAGQ